MVHQHLDGTLSLTHGPHRLGRYTAQGKHSATTKTPARRAVEKTRSGKVKEPTFPPCLEIPQSARDSHFPTAPTTAGVNVKPDISCATKSGHFNLLTTTEYFCVSLAHDMSG